MYVAEVLSVHREISTNIFMKKNEHKIVGNFCDASWQTRLRYVGCPNHSTLPASCHCGLPNPSCLVECLLDSKKHEVDNQKIEKIGLRSFCSAPYLLCLLLFGCHFLIAIYVTRKKSKFLSGSQHP